MFEMASHAFSPIYVLTSDGRHQIICIRATAGTEKRVETESGRRGGMDKGRTFLDDRSVAGDGIAPEIEEYSVVDDCNIDIMLIQYHWMQCIGIKPSFTRSQS